MRTTVQRVMVTKGMRRTVEHAGEGGDKACHGACDGHVEERLARLGEAKEVRHRAKQPRLTRNRVTPHHIKRRGRRRKR